MSDRPEEIAMIIGHIFDSDGNPIGANIALSESEIDGERCIAVRGIDWFARMHGLPVGEADDVQFCVPVEQLRDVLALSEPTTYTVFGTYAGFREAYTDRPEPQPQRWSRVVRAKSPRTAIRLARHEAEHNDEGFPTGDEAIVAGCVAGKVEALA